MNKTVELLNQIKSMLQNGSLKQSDINIEDIEEATLRELAVKHVLYTEEQFDNELKNYAEMVKSKDSGTVWGLIEVINASINFIESIPNEKKYYQSRWWISKHEDKDINELAEYIEKTGEVNVFNYPFVDKYKDLEVPVFVDEESGYSYVNYKEKKMYFPIGWEDEKIKGYCRGIYLEQDTESPHSYKMPGYEVEEGDVVIDAGVAEGNFSLEVVDKVKKLYLIEADEEWIEPLKLSFRDYKDKVVIVKKYLDEKTFDDHIALDDITDEKVNYIKMDIEGFEKAALRGGEKTIAASDNLRVALCTYHCKEDAEYISNFLSERDFETCFSKGYMFPEWSAGALVNAELRKGLLFGRKLTL